MTLRNVFACLVHENQDCVIDLVHNLRCLDPTSLVLLYDGGGDRRLLQCGFPFHRYHVVVVPDPRLMVWGRLHGFALDCMRFLLGSVEFDTVTIVDSDQLATQPGYSQRLAEVLDGQPSIGMLVSCPGRQGPGTTAGLAQVALRERDRWLPVLARFGDAEPNFPCWSLWPSTVFTAAAVRDIVRTFDEEPALHRLLESTGIWATEEVVFPTLVATLGYQLVKSPFSFDYVQYNATYSESDVISALNREDVFWIHPVSRSYEDPIRARLRNNRELPDAGFDAGHWRMRPPQPAGKIMDTALERMRPVAGWLEEDEADLLITACMRAVTSTMPGAAVVEVGSYQGRSTVALGSVVAGLSPDRRVYAVDPHLGVSGTPTNGPSTLSPFLENISRAGLSHAVVPVQTHSFDVAWDTPIGFLFIDGLHDYANVARDFFAFEPSVVTGGIVAFHDYAPNYPGVQTFVQELMGTGNYRHLASARSLVVAVKEATAPDDGQSLPVGIASGFGSGREPDDVRRVDRPAGTPLVSCIMPTSDRPMLLQQAIAYFLRQRYVDRELVIIDSGMIPVRGAIPADCRIRYIRIQGEVTLGELRNIACEHARGDVIVHWDDDDWSAPWRVDYQVGQLLRQPSAGMCGLSELVFYDPSGDRCWKYSYPMNGPWVCGGTLCYHRSVWRKQPFRSINSGEDTSFVWEADRAAILALPRSDFYVATIHHDNTCPRPTSDPGWEPVPSAIARDMLGADHGFYINWSR